MRYNVFITYPSYPTTSSPPGQPHPTLYLYIHPRISACPTWKPILNSAPPFSRADRKVIARYQSHCFSGEWRPQGYMQRRRFPRVSSTMEWKSNSIKGHIKNSQNLSSTIYIYIYFPTTQLFRWELLLINRSDIHLTFIFQMGFLFWQKCVINATKRWTGGCLKAALKNSLQKYIFFCI